MGGCVRGGPHAFARRRLVCAAECLRRCGFLFKLRACACSIRVGWQGEIVQDAFLEADEGFIISLCRLSEPLDPVALGIAVRFVEQYRIVRWCIEQNKVGVAPSSHALLTEFQKNQFEWPHGIRPRPWGHISDPGQAQFLDFGNLPSPSVRQVLAASYGD